MRKIQIVLVAGWLGIASMGKAQHLPGAAMGNYSGTQALYHNPAFVADSRYSFYINVASTQAYIAGNHAKYGAPYSLISLATNSVPDQYRTERGTIDLRRRDIKETLNGRLKRLNGGGDIRLPSLMITLPGGRYGAAVTLRARLGLNSNQVTEPIARLARGGTRESNLMEEQVYKNQAGNLHINGLGEAAITFGGIILDDETDFFKAGITAKRLLGLYNAHAEIKNASFEIVPDPAWNNRKEIIRIPTINTRYGYTSENAFQDFRPSPNWLLGSMAAGSGWGLDLGVVYEYRPAINKYSYTEKGIRKRDATKNKYLYRLAVSLTDIGRVNFSNPTYVKQQEVTAVDKGFGYDAFQRLQGSDGFFAAVSSSLGVPAPQPASFKSVLPTAFQASLDYNIKPNVYVNTLWVQNLRSPSAFGMKAESVLAFTPRYEHRWYELSVPVSLMNRYSSLGIGLAGRIGPLWFGTDHLTALLNIGRPKVFNFYFGVSAGLFRRPPQSPTRCWPLETSWWKRLFQRNEYR